MKLIYLSSARIPTEKAHGLQIMKNCQAFAARGAAVTLVVPRRLNPIKEEPFDYYGVSKDFRIVRLPCLDAIFFDRYLGGRLAFVITSLSFLLVARIYLTFKRYDLIYSRDELTGRFFSKFIFEAHEFPRAVRPYQRTIWKRAGALIVLTAGLKRLFIEHGVAEETILVAPDGADLKEAETGLTKEGARARLGLPDDRKLSMYVGSLYLYDWKGVDVLVEAAKTLDRVLVVLVGGSDDEVRRLSENYPGNNLMLVERKPHGEIPVWLRAADVLVLPNKSGDVHSEKYTSPLKLFEYMASGTPIVASDLPSIREVLNEANAVLVAPNDPAALAAGVTRVLDDPQSASRLAGQARLEVEKFSWSNRAGNILAFIEKK